MTRYEVTAAVWTSELYARFGPVRQVHELSDEEVVNSIIKFGRASISPYDQGMILNFENESILRG